MKIKIFVAALLLASCSSFLDEEPKDQIPESEAYTDAASLYRNTVSTLYANFGGYVQGEGLQGTYHGIYDISTFTTDEAIIPTRGGDWYDGGFWQSLFLHEWHAGTDAFKNAWLYLYKVITTANRSLETLEANKALLTQEQLAAYKAEVRAVRAMYYYYLLDLFGRVPLVTTTDVSMRQVHQSERSEVFRFTFSELQEVAPLLPAERSNQLGDYYGRVTRPVAYFLLAKLALNAEVFTDDDPTDGQRPSGADIFFTVDGQRLNAWQACIAYCDGIRDMGYALAEDFGANFAVHNETSVENILTIPMDPAAYTNQMQNLFRSYHYAHASAYGFTGENGSSATLEALATFGYGTAEQDKRFDLSYYAGAVTDLAGEPVLLQSGEPLTYKPEAVRLILTDSPDIATAGARMRKYEVDKTATKDGKLMNNDIVIFRYADALLMKAEAQVRDGGDGSEALNAVRQRAGMGQRAATLDNILAERQLELAWEGWRRQDLVRYGRFGRAYSDRPQVTGEETGFTDLFPIPADVIATNANLQQNPGY